MLHKKILLTTITLFLATSIFSQEILNNLNTSWSTVLDGKVITSPILTSYGFCIATDGRTLSAFSQKGTLLWEKRFSKNKGALINILPGDFIICISDSNKKISLLNPSGSEIWSKTSSFQITTPPFSGRDGRFFVKGKSSLACYGITGSCKWQLDLPLLNNLQIQELPDGSLIVFLDKLKNDKSQALRVSPFGQIIEEITFSGIISKVDYCSQGILLIFEDGTSGLFSISQADKNICEHKWLVKNSDFSNPSELLFVVSQNKEQIIFLCPQKDCIKAYNLNASNGDIINSFEIYNINAKNIKLSYLNNNYLLICDEKNAICQTNLGNIMWQAVLPNSKDNNGWNYIFSTNNNTLIICKKNWTLDAYRYAQINSKDSIENKDYNDWYNINKDYNQTLLYLNKIDPDIVSSERYNQIKNGFYGPKEVTYLSDLKNLINSYQNDIQSSDFGVHVEKSLFSTDLTSLNSACAQLGLYSSDYFINDIANILKIEKNTTIQLTLLNAIEGYDPNGKILDSLEYLAKNTNPKNQAIICKICDAVYEICKFMGRPAFNSKGRSILQNFLYPNYNLQTRNYSRDIFKKISNLDL